MHGVLADARVVLGAVRDSPQWLHRVEQAITGRPADGSALAAASAAFDDETVDDVHCSARYRREMAKVQLRRALRDALEGSTT